MKKRIFSAALALTLWAGSATAAVLTDAPGTPTQDRAVDLTAAWADGQATDYDLAEQPADLLTMNTSKDVFLYVYEQENRPVTWYPEQTQRAIAEMARCDPDALHMSELFRLHAPETDVQSDLDVTLTLDIDYAPGQLTVAVLGDTSDPENVVWTPVESRVTKVGQVELVIPKALMEQLQGEDVLFTLLTVRKGGGHKTVQVETTAEPDSLPSKQAGDEVRVEKTVRSDGTVAEDDFELEIAPETQVIRQEITRLGEHLDENQPALDWLPEADQERVRCLLKEAGVDPDSLVITDYVPLITKDFDHTDGDALATLAFATPYEPGQVILTALGVPKQGAVEDGETLMDWAVQPAVVRDGGHVDIVFDQLALIGMGEETGLLLMFSVPAEE